MSQPISTEEHPEGNEPEEQPTEPQTEAPEGDGGQTPEEQPPAPTREDELPEWARTELTKVRGEAARYRTKLRETEAKLAEAKSPEEFDTVIAELTADNKRLEREVLVGRIASKHKLPNELAELLKGDSEAELEAHAEKLAKFAPAEEIDPEHLEGGLTPRSPGDGETNDPRELARQYGRGRRNAR